MIDRYVETADAEEHAAERLSHVAEGIGLIRAPAEHESAEKSLLSDSETRADDHVVLAKQTADQREPLIAVPLLSRLAPSKRFRRAPGT